MILQSKQHDYYDSIIHKYRDNKIVFKREEQRFNLAYFSYQKTDRAIEDRDIANLFAKYTKSLTWRTGFLTKGEIRYEDIYVLLFCGKAYPFYEKTVAINSYSDSITRDFINPHSHIPEDSYVFRSDDFLFLNENYKGEGIVDTLVEKVNKKYSPIVLLHKQRSIIINPILKDLNFPMHAHDAAQNLLQFLAPIEPNMITIDDKHKAQAHGFDQESFRRAPGGPTRKRKPKKAALQPMQITLPNKKAFRLPKEK